MSERPVTFMLIERLSNLLRMGLRAAGAAANLEPVHLQALYYLDHANHYSNTPLAVADYLGLAKGNMSQRLIALERAGYLRRSADPADGRVSHLTVTTKGRALLRTTVPPSGWHKTLNSLAPEARLGLERGLLELLLGLQAAHGLRAFGMCQTCRHFLREQGRYRCGLTGQALAATQTTRLCREHESPTEQEQRP